MIKFYYHIQLNVNKFLDPSSFHPSSSPITILCHPRVGWSYQQCYDYITVHDTALRRSEHWIKRATFRRSFSKLFCFAESQSPAHDRIQAPKIKSHHRILSTSYMLLRSVSFSFYWPHQMLLLGRFFIRNHSDGNEIKKLRFASQKLNKKQNPRWFLSKKKAKGKSTWTFCADECEGKEESSRWK